MPQIHQRLVAAFTAHVIIVVQPLHPPMLVAITTVNQEIQAQVPLPAFSIVTVVILSGMGKSEVQREPAATMDEPLHGLV